LGEGGFQRRFSAGNVVVAGQGSDLRAVFASGGISGSVGVFALKADSTVLDDVFEGVIHESTLATLVSLTARAIHKLLLRETLERVSGQEPGTLNGSGGGERPA